MPDTKTQAPKKPRFGRRLYKLFIFLVILTGIGLLAYPTVSNWWNEWHRSRAIADYENIMADMSQVDLAAMLDGAAAYNAGLLHNALRFKPSDEDLAEYNQIMDVTGTGIMGYIEIPRIDVKLPIYHTVDEAVLEIAVGHMSGSSIPVGNHGNTGSHAVLSGHRGLPSAKLFTHLDKLETGDLFQVHILDQVMTYVIYDIEIVLPDEMSSLAIDPDRDLITLVTCTPYGVNSHRILVHGERNENLIQIAHEPDSSQADQDMISDSESGSNSDSGSDSGEPGGAVIAIVVIILLLLVIVIAACVRSGHGGEKNHDSGTEGVDGQDLSGPR